jgi:hypothetical protein
MFVILYLTTNGGEADRSTRFTERSRFGWFGGAGGCGFSTDWWGVSIFAKGSHFVIGGLRVKLDVGVAARHYGNTGEGGD